MKLQGKIQIFPNPSEKKFNNRCYFLFAVVVVILLPCIVKPKCYKYLQRYTKLYLIDPQKTAGVTVSVSEKIIFENYPATVRHVNISKTG